MDIKESFYGKLNELREPKKLSKERKKDVINTTTKHSYKDYDDAHEKNVAARKKYMRDKTPESKDEVDRTEADRVKKGKRARTLQRKSEKLGEDVSSLLAGTLAAVPAAVGLVKSGAVDKTFAMLKKLKKKIQKKKLEEASSGKPPRSEHSWPTSLDKKTGKWMWANAFKGGHESAEAANKHAKEMIEKNKKTKVNLSDLKPRSK
jgi:hypothetical protein